MRAGMIAILVVVVGLIIAALNSLFIVNPMQQALVLQFGEVKQAIRDPGLNTKIPVVQDVLFFDKRVLDLNVPAQEIIAADQKRLVVDAFMRYRIADPVRFFQTVNNVREGSLRLSTFAQSSLRAVLADATFTDIVRDNRDELMQRITDQVAANAQGIGVQVVDMRIRRADLPEANSEAIFRRMQTEREQEAAQIRAEGEEAARRIVAAAQREATVLRAEAQREAEQIRGQGDGQRNAIFASAFSQDPEFFAFYRAMQAYEASLASGDTRLVLSPDADFFRFFNDPRGLSRAQVEAGASESVSEPAVLTEPVVEPVVEVVPEDVSSVAPAAPVEEAVAVTTDSAADDGSTPEAAAAGTAATDSAATTDGSTDVTEAGSTDQPFVEDPTAAAEVDAALSEVEAAVAQAEADAAAAVAEVEAIAADQAENTTTTVE